MCHMPHARNVSRTSQGVWCADPEPSLFVCVCPTGQEVDVPAGSDLNVPNLSGHTRDSSSSLGALFREKASRTVQAGLAITDNWLFFLLLHEF